MLKRLILLFFIWGSLCDASAQVNHEQLVKAYFEENLDLWRQTIDRADATKLNVLKEIVNYEYGYIGFCLGKNNQGEAKKRIAVMYKHLELLERDGYDAAMLNMYRSALCAFELSMNHWKFATLGVESVRLANLAYKQAPQNPFVLSLKGNTDFYRPPMAGGSKKRAIEIYEKAIILYEKQNLTHHWNYAATLLTLAQAYEKTGNKAQAKTICEKILKFAPNFKYVRDTYYPQLIKS